MTAAMTENRKQDARSEGDPAQTSGPPAIHSPQTTEEAAGLRDDVCRTYGAWAFWFCVPSAYALG